MKNETCLIVGANGFIGSYMVDKFTEQTNITVRALDRFSKAAQFNEASNIEVVKGDVFNDEDLKKALEGVTYVLHSFSATTPFVSDQNPYIDITDNLQRSVRLFELCAEAGVKKIGFISSGGAIYGSIAEAKPAEETDAPLPVSPYGINKLSIEHYLEYFKRRYGMDYVAYRLTNPYGPRQVTKNNQGVIPAFIEKIRNEEEITIYGDGETSRDYIYIEDAASMVAASFLADNKYSVYNIGSGVQSSLNEIVKILSTITDKPTKVKYEEAPATFLKKTMVSTERFTQEYGLTAATSLEDGLRETLRKPGQA